jgi:hypothetical protein
MNKTEVTGADLFETLGKHTQHAIFSVHELVALLELSLQKLVVGIFQMELQAQLMDEIRQRLVCSCHCCRCRGTLFWQQLRQIGTRLACTRFCERALDPLRGSCSDAPED